MPEQKWIEFTGKIEHLITAYNGIKKERDELKNGVEELAKQNTRLTRGNKDDVLLKERIRVLEEERKVIQEKVKKLLKILKEY